MFKTIETYVQWKTFDSAFDSCHMKLLHANTNLLTVSLDFTSLCPNKRNATWYNTWLQKLLSFYKWGHRSVNRSIIIFNLSFFTHSHCFWNQTEFSVSSTNTCPVRISNITSSLAVLVTKRPYLCCFIFISLQRPVWAEKTSISSHLGTATCLHFCIRVDKGVKQGFKK